MTEHTKKQGELKAAYVRYFADVPVQRYAAMAIGKDEDTVIRWRKQDKTFADAVQKAKATWIRKKVLETKAEFALERLEAGVFGRRAGDIDLTINMPAPTIYLPQELPYDIVNAKTGNPIPRPVVPNLKV